VIEDFNQIVKNNQARLDYVKSRNRKNSFDDRILGTVDVAVSRLNNIFLILSQQPLDAMNLGQQLYHSQNALSDFVTQVKKMDQAHYFLKWFYKLKIHMIGKNKLKSIKKLLTMVENSRV